MLRDRLRLWEVRKNGPRHVVEGEPGTEATDDVVD